MLSIEKLSHQRNVETVLDSNIYANDFDMQQAEKAIL